MLKRVALRYFGELHFGVRLRGYYLAKALQNIQRVATVLEIGCNRGQTSFWLHRRFPYATINAMDIDSSLIAHCSMIAQKQDVCNLSFRTADLLDLQDENKYDLIVCFDVLEHIADWETALHRLAEALKPNGYLLIHTPHKGRFQDSRFGLRRWFNSLETNGNSEHVHEGFVPEDFGVLAGIDYEIIFTFNLLTMWSHTWFEVYRSHSWLWHLVFTLPLLGIGMWDARFKKTDGGGLLIWGTRIADNLATNR